MVTDMTGTMTDLTETTKAGWNPLRFQEARPALTEAAIAAPGIHFRHRSTYSARCFLNSLRQLTNVPIHSLTFFSVTPPVNSIT